ncbi:MAG: PfkB family carbohydrate kinase, partial [Phycisphaerales bacterium]
IVLDAAAQDAFVGAAAEAAAGCDGAVIADFGNGLLSGYVLDRLAPALRRRVPILAGDVSGRRAGLLRMREMDLLCPSEHEVRETFRSFAESIPAVAARLLGETGGKSAIITMGAEGLIAFAPHSGVRMDQPVADGDSPLATRLRSEHVPALGGHAIDALGCGDALLSTATLALVAGGGLLQGAFLGALAAACEAQRIGNIPISTTDLRQALVRLHTSRLVFDPQAAIPALRAASMV